MLGRLALVVIVICGMAPPVAAQATTTTERYELGRARVAAADETCKTEATAGLSSEAAGLSAVQYPRPHFWASNVTGVMVLAYTDVMAVSAFGSMQGHMTCVVVYPRKTISEIVFQFSDPGLAGFRDINGGPRSESRKTFVHLDTLVPIPGMP